MMYLFAYDISDNRRRARVSKELEKFGLRVQKSFFQVDVAAERAERLKELLLARIDPKTDSLLFYPLCADCLGKAMVLGDGQLLQDVSFEIL